MVSGGQKLQVVAGRAEYFFDKVEVDGRHLRAQDGVAGVLHLLGEAHLGERRGLGRALGLQGVLMRGEHRLIRGGFNRAGGANLELLARGGSLRGTLRRLVLERGHERADADARGAKV